MKKYLILAFLMFLNLGLAVAQNVNTDSSNRDLPKNSPLLVSYTCPMHPEITSDKPGACPVCGMDLLQKANVQYICPMHPEVTSATPGKCPKCGMDLELKTSATYSCPMHPEVTSMKPGKCSICGMQLQKAKTKAMNHKMHGGCGM